MLLHLVLEYIRQYVAVYIIKSRNVICIRIIRDMIWYQKKA